MVRQAHHRHAHHDTLCRPSIRPAPNRVIPSDVASFLRATSYRGSADAGHSLLRLRLRKGKQGDTAFFIVMPPCWGTDVKEQENPPSLRRGSAWSQRLSFFLHCFYTQHPPVNPTVARRLGGILMAETNHVRAVSWFSKLSSRNLVLNCSQDTIPLSYSAEMDLSISRMATGWQ